MIILYILLSLIYASMCIDVNSNEYIDTNNPDEYDSDDKSSSESISNEVYNYTSNIRPERIQVNISFIDNDYINAVTDITNTVKEYFSTTTMEIVGPIVASFNKTDDTGDNLMPNAAHPYSVSIERKGAHYASGALIAKRWILTVASEFYNAKELIKLFRARLGSVDCKKGGTVVPLQNIEIHPSYQPMKPNFDVALLKIGVDIVFTDYLRPIGLSKVKGKVIGAKFLTSYWPRIIIHNKAIPKTAQERIKQNSMRVSTQKLIPWDKCFKVMQNSITLLDESSLCLKPVALHHSPCMPDAGAPVVADDGLWGVTSGWTSSKCRLQPSPTIFTRVSAPAIREWLDSLLLYM